MAEAPGVRLIRDRDSTPTIQSTFKYQYWGGGGGGGGSGGWMRGRGGRE